MPSSHSHDLVTSGHPLVAVVCLVGTVLAALLAVVAGVVLVRRVATAWQGPGGRSLT